MDEKHTTSQLEYKKSNEEATAAAIEVLRSKGTINGAMISMAYTTFAQEFGAQYQKWKPLLKNLSTWLSQVCG